MLIIIYKKSYVKYIFKNKHAFNDIYTNNILKKIDSEKY